MGRSKKKETPLAVTLGAQIRGRRLGLQLTQEELASQLGVEVNTVSRMECGTHLPSLQRLEDIARVLDVSVASLLGAASAHVKDQTVQLQELLSGLSDSERSFVVELVRQQSEFLKARKKSLLSGGE